MKTFGNILWLIFGGVEMAITYFLTGVLACITLIGIPFGKQCFRIARFAIWPIGTTVNTYYSYYPIANTVWLLFGGLPLAIAYFVTGILFCITLIGIPFGKQYFKLARLSFGPFGSIISR